MLSDLCFNNTGIISTKMDIDSQYLNQNHLPEGGFHNILTIPIKSQCKMRKKPIIIQGLTKQGK